MAKITHYIPLTFPDSEEEWQKIDDETSKKVVIATKITQKHYTVWVGRIPGVYNNWQETEAQVIGFSGAKYKSYPSKEEAEKAFEDGFEIHIPN